ncbi:MAG: carotenoid biosynthesis protein [Candidatus Binatia bacterium]
MPEPTAWVTAFVLVSYLMGIACLCLAFRIGSAGGWPRGLREVGILLFFCGLGYTVESWAHARTPYYYYAKAFPDRVARVPFHRMDWLPTPRDTACLRFVQQAMPEEVGSREIPLAIPIFEGSLAFVALWTSRFLGGPLLLRPIFAGLALVTVDAFLDPIVASTYDCGGNLIRQGLGFWRWYVDPAYIADWYGIPLFNFAGWYAAAAMLVALAYLIGWGRDFARWAAPTVFHGLAPAERPPIHRAGLWLTVAGTLGLAVGLSPSLDPPPSPSLQWSVLLAVVGGSLAAVVFHARRFTTVWSEVRELTYPIGLALAFGGFAFVVSGQFLRAPSFLLVTVVLVAAGALLAWWPYQATVFRHAVRLVDADRFLRLHFVAYPWLLTLLGAAFAAGGTPTATRVGGAAGGRLGVPRPRPRAERRHRPADRPHPGPARAIPWCAAPSVARRRTCSRSPSLPVMLLLTNLGGAGLAPLAWVTLACGLMAAYNRWGKMCPVPPLSVLIQGLAWGALALFGARVMGELATIPWLVAAYGTGFMLLINGIHGGLRDLANDVGCQRRNTAIWLGAEPDPRDPFRTRSTGAVAVFAFAVQSAMLALLLWVLWRDELPYHLPDDATLRRVVRGAVLVAFGVVALRCHVLLWRLVKPGWARRDEAGSMHAFMILLLPVVVFLPALDPFFRFLVPLCFLLPLLIQYVDPIVGAVFPALRGRIGDGVPQ